MSDDTAPIEVPITDHLDLHTFDPRQLPQLIEDYLDACRQKGMVQVRLIHGKGGGVLKARVRCQLSRHPAVRSFQDASDGAGGWGATVVFLDR